MAPPRVALLFDLDGTLVCLNGAGVS